MALHEKPADLRVVRGLLVLLRAEKQRAVRFDLGRLLRAAADPAGDVWAARALAAGVRTRRPARGRHPHRAADSRVHPAPFRSLDDPLRVHGAQRALMRWVAVFALGFFAATALLAAAYGANAVDLWQSHREVYLGEIATLEADPGYPNREFNLRSARAQIETLDRAALQATLASVLALAIAVAAFVPLWRRTTGSFTRTRLIAYVALCAGVLVVASFLALVMLSAGVIRG